MGEAINFSAAEIVAIIVFALVYVEAGLRNMQLALLLDGPDSGAVVEGLHRQDFSTRLLVWCFIALWPLVFGGMRLAHLFQDWRTVWSKKQ